jgi:hypothetical protein
MCNYNLMKFIFAVNSLWTLYCLMICIASSFGVWIVVEVLHHNIALELVSPQSNVAFLTSYTLNLWLWTNFLYMCISLVNKIELECQEPNYIVQLFVLYILRGFKTSATNAFRLPYSIAFCCSIRSFLDFFHSWLCISHFSRFFGDGLVFSFLQVFSES